MGILMDDAFSGCSPGDPLFIALDRVETRRNRPNFHTTQINQYSVLGLISFYFSLFQNLSSDFIRLRKYPIQALIIPHIIVHPFDIMLTIGTSIILEEENC